MVVVIRNTRELEDSYSNKLNMLFFFLLPLETENASGSFRNHTRYNLKESLGYRR